MLLWFLARKFPGTIGDDMPGPPDDPDQDYREFMELYNLNYNQEEARAEEHEPERHVQRALVHMDVPEQQEEILVVNNENAEEQHELQHHDQNAIDDLNEQEEGETSDSYGSAESTHEERHQDHHAIDGLNEVEEISDTNEGAESLRDQRQPLRPQSPHLNANAGSHRSRSLRRRSPHERKHKRMFYQKVLFVLFADLVVNQFRSYTYVQFKKASLLFKCSKGSEFTLITSSVFVDHIECVRD